VAAAVAVGRSLCPIAVIQSCLRPSGSPKEPINQARLLSNLGTHKIDAVTRARQPGGRHRRDGRSTCQRLAEQIQAGGKLDA
jgi:hypothetical protein